VKAGVEEGVGGKICFGSGGEVVEVMDHRVDGKWDGYFLTDGTVKFFIRPAAALRYLEVKHH